MSGLCGLVWLDGRPASEKELAPMLAALAPRGPDGKGSWSGGPAALGFRLLATTPEAAREPQPLRHPESGCLIVADARLDDREALAARLRLDPGEVGDAGLILAAYQRWGDEAPLHLIGDFAFAIWDGARRRLLAARDLLGLRQIHVAHLPGKLLAFATDDHALVAHGQVPARLNLVRVADFLVDLEGADLTSTFYRDVERLPPAHLLLCEGKRVAIRRYWSLEPQAPLGGSPREQESEFLHLFEQSVGERLRCAGRVGAMLSGGLDSSAVVAVATRLQRDRGGEPLPTFSGTSADDPDCIETGMIRQVQALGHLQPFELSHDHAEAREALLEPALSSRNPFDFHMSLLRGVYDLAARNGCKVVLDGVAGDVLLDYSGGPARLLRQGRAIEAWRHIEGERLFFRGSWSTASHFRSALRTALAPEWVKRLKREADLVRDRRRPPDFLRPEFAREIGLAERFDLQRRAAPSRARSFAEERVVAVTHPFLVVGRERYDRVSSRSAVEPRDPFMDLRLVTFCLGLPMEQLAATTGWTKLILRSAMAGLLPESVRWRRGKQHLGYLFNERLREGDGLAEWQAAVRLRRDLLAAVVKPDVLHEAECSGLPLSRDAIRIQTIARWLQVTEVEA